MRTCFFYGQTSFWYVDGTFFYRETRFCMLTAQFLSRNVFLCMLKTHLFHHETSFWPVGTFFYRRTSFWYVDATPLHADGRFEICQRHAPWANPLWNRTAPDFPVASDHIKAMKLRGVWGLSPHSGHVGSRWEWGTGRITSKIQWFSIIFGGTPVYHGLSTRQLSTSIFRQSWLVKDMSMLNITQPWGYGIPWRILKMGPACRWFKQRSIVPAAIGLSCPSSFSAVLPSKCDLTRMYGEDVLKSMWITLQWPCAFGESLMCFFHAGHWVILFPARIRVRLCRNAGHRFLGYATQRVSLKIGGNRRGTPKYFNWKRKNDDQ